MERKKKEKKKEMFDLMRHSTHLWLYTAEYMVADHSVNEETSCGALAGMRNSSMGPS